MASVGNTAITAIDVKNEYRLELFLDGKSPVAEAPDVKTLDQVRERMIDRVLLDQEARASDIKVADDDKAVDQRVEGIRNRFQSAASYQDGLQALHMTEADLRQDLAEQEAILQLIDQRLRPEATVEPAEIETYYRDTFVPQLARQGEQPPPLTNVTDRIREILVQQKINGLLEDWLRRLRAAREVKTYGSAEAEAASPGRTPE